MKRVFDGRWSLVVLFIIWLCILCVPTLRVLLLRQTIRPSWNEGSAPFSLVKPLVRSENEEAENATRFPNDAQTQVDDEYQRLGEGDKSGADLKNLGRAYATVWKRFPREKWLLAQSLQLQMAFLLQKRAVETNGATSNSSMPTPTTAEVAEVLKLAQQGQNLDPQNAFYDAVVVSCLFAQRRDADALSSLRAMSRKTFFDDESMRVVQERISSRALSSSLLIEDRASIAAAQLFPAYAAFRQSARLAVAEARRAEQSGDHARALEIYGDVMRLGSLMSDSNSTLILSLVGRATESMAWRRGAEIKNATALSDESRRKAGEARIRRDSSSFARYASTRGRPDLAREALQRADKTVVLLRQTTKYFNANDAVFGVPSKTFSGILTLKSLGTILVSQLQFSLVAWFAFSLIVLWQRRQGNLKSASRRDVGIVALWSALAVALFLFVIAQNGSPETNFWEQSDNQNQTLAVWLPILAVVWPFIFGTIWSASAIWHRSRKLQKPRAAIEKRPLGDANTPLLKRDLSPFFSPVVPFALVALAVFMVLYLIASINQSPGDSAWYLSSALFLVLAALLWWHRKNHSSTRMNAQSGAPNTRYLFAWIRASLGASIVVASAFYLATSLLALPLRQEADAGLNQIMRDGEVALIRQQKL